MILSDLFCYTLHHLTIPQSTSQQSKDQDEWLETTIACCAYFSSRLLVTRIMASHGQEKIGDQRTTVNEQEPVSRTDSVEEAKRSSGMATSLAR